MMTVVGEQAVAPGAVESEEVPTGLTRRVFGVLMGAGIAGIVGGGSLIAAGQHADNDGGISRGEGVWTSFGSVRINAAERQARNPQVPGADHAAANAQGGHGGHAVASKTAQPFNLTWGDHMMVELEVHNGLDRKVLFSPGQLRLKVGADGPTVTNRGPGTGKGALEPGSTSHFWISFLVPSDVQDISAEFTDPWSDGGPLALELPEVLQRPGWLEADHG
jgi:hypothetical protein